MIPTNFKESNKVYSKPDGMTHDQCEALCVHQGITPEGYPIIISCWKLTQAEVSELITHGRVWVVHYGTQLPPHALTTQSPFNET